MILLNPGPANTTETVKQAMTRPDICPREKEFGRLMADVARSVTRVVHAGDKYVSVLFGGSGTAAVEAAVSSAVQDSGRLLVVDNGSYGARMAQIAAAHQIPHDVLPFGVGGYPAPDRVAEQLGRRPYTHLAVVHHETSTGILNPVEEIGRLCRAGGVEMIVDAMSSYAGLPIDIEEMGADYLVSSSNKCIQGMAGLGFVICRRDRLESMESIPGRSLYLDLVLQHRFFQQKGQMRYTPPVQVVYALHQALEEYFDEGPSARHERYRDNWSALDSGMTELGFRRLLPEAQLSHILTAYIEPDNERYDFNSFHDALFARGYTIYPGKGASEDTFRLANMGAVYPKDMRGFIEALTATIEEMDLLPLYAATDQ